LRMRERSVIRGICAAFRGRSSGVAGRTARTGGAGQRADHKIG